jgi:hypothetical protein
MGRCLGRKDETKNSRRTSVGKFIATEEHRKWRRESLSVDTELGLSRNLS